jgi:hypothetical protein
MLFLYRKHFVDVLHTNHYNQSLNTVKYTEGEHQLQRTNSLAITRLVSMVTNCTSLRIPSV